MCYVKQDDVKPGCVHSGVNYLKIKKKSKFRLQRKTRFYSDELVSNSHYSCLPMTPESDYFWVWTPQK